MTISARISNALKEKGIPQKAIAEAVDVAASTVSTWMKSNGDNIPSGYIMPICRLLDMQPEELLEGAEHRDVIEIIPDDYVQLSKAEQRLLNIFRGLDEESQIVVLNAAVMEKRASSARGMTALMRAKKIWGQADILRPI